VQIFGHFLLFSKQSNLYCKTDEKVAQLQKSKVEIFTHLYLFFQNKTIYIGNKLKSDPAPEVGGGIPTGKKFVIS